MTLVQRMPFSRLIGQGISHRATTAPFPSHMLTSERKELPASILRHYFGSKAAKIQPLMTDKERAAKASYEETHHLARALSKISVSPEQQRKWSKSIKPLQKDKWDRLPLEEDRFNPHYEMDALTDIHQRSFESNVLLEIRDVRLPASTHHPSFIRLAKHRRHLICYTHADVIDAPTRNRVEDWTRRSWPNAECMFVDTRDSRGDPQCFDDLYDWIATRVDKSGGINSALTVGVPNTGKSSVLLSLLKSAKKRGLIPKQTKAKVQAVSKKKKKKKKKVNLKKQGAPGILDKPGKTRELTEYMMRETPRMFFLDVPGLTPPFFFFEERPEAWYGFGAANLLALDKYTEKDPYTKRSFCEYVLHCCNRDGLFQYVKKLDLDKPTADIDVVLSKISNKHADRKDEEWLLQKRATNFLKLFNTGNLGPVILDDIRKPYQTFVFRDKHFTSKKRGRGAEKEEDDDYNDDFHDDFKGRITTPIKRRGKAPKERQQHFEEEDEFSFKKDRRDRASFEDEYTDGEDSDDGSYDDGEDSDDGSYDDRYEDDDLWFEDEEDFHEGRGEWNRKK